jgi:hypothetical protein
MSEALNKTPEAESVTPAPYEPNTYDLSWITEAPIVVPDKQNACQELNQQAKVMSDDIEKWRKELMEVDGGAQYPTRKPGQSWYTPLPDGDPRGNADFAITIDNAVKICGWIKDASSDEKVWNYWGGAPCAWYSLCGRPVAMVMFETEPAEAYIRNLVVHPICSGGAAIMCEHVLKEQWKCGHKPKIKLTPMGDLSEKSYLEIGFERENPNSSRLILDPQSEKNQKAGKWNCHNQVWRYKSSGFTATKNPTRPNRNLSKQGAGEKYLQLVPAAPVAVIQPANQIPEPGRQVPAALNVPGAEREAELWRRAQDAIAASKARRAAQDAARQQNPRK